MPRFTIIKPLRTEDGIDRKENDVIDLTDRQAKYLLLSGKIKPAAQKTKKEKIDHG